MPREWLYVPSCCMIQFIFVCLWWKTAKSVHGISRLSRKSARLFSMQAYKVYTQAFLSAVLAAGIVDSMWKDMPRRWHWNARWTGMAWRNVQRAQSHSHYVRFTYLGKDCIGSVIKWRSCDCVARKCRGWLTAGRHARGRPANRLSALISWLTQCRKTWMTTATACSVGCQTHGRPTLQRLVFHMFHA